MALDFGLKRTGIAVTDDMQIIASGLKTVDSAQLMIFLKEYVEKNKVEAIVLGEPKFMDGKPMEIEQNIIILVEELRKNFPEIKIDRIDERFTSKMAMQSMIAGGLGKKARANKALVDEISATIILQSYMEQRNR